ncbi:MAG: hypothetical protein LRS47_01820 [Desulfurococcales archaeon]|nr:hypothetical protein [Desulfurococcales archaeon]
MGCINTVLTNNTIPDSILDLYPDLAIKQSTGEDWWIRARKSRVLIDWFKPVTRKMLEDKGCLELVIARSSGYDYIDLDAAEENGVCIANQPEIIGITVAEHAVAGILASLLSVIEAYNHMPKWAADGWPRWIRRNIIHGKSLGLLGTGRIGSGVLAKLWGFGLEKVYYYSRTPKPQLEAVYNAERTGVERLFRKSDIVVNSLPLTRETRGLVTSNLIAVMPPYGVYVNVGRGGTEAEGAVEEAARLRPDLRFVLDVHPEEPLQTGHPRMRMYGREGVILTPHLAGYSVESYIGTTILALAQARDYLEKGCVWNPVAGPCKPCSEKSIGIEEALAKARELALRTK